MRPSQRRAPSWRYDYVRRRARYTEGSGFLLPRRVLAGWLRDRRKVDDEKADQLFQILRRAHDLAADAARAFAIGELDAGDVTHLELDLDRLMLRMADARALEACAGAKRN